MSKKANAIPPAETTVVIESSDKSDRRSYLDTVLERARQAAKAFETYSQEQVDKIVEEVALVGASSRITLAELAVEETGMGIVVDKVIKNHFAAEYIFNQIRNIPTCGVISDDKINRIKIIAHPVGVVIAVIPMTNPTSTAMFKSLSNLKARNSVIFAPHPRAAHCTAETVRIMRKAAIKAGAPENVLQVIADPSPEDTAYLMANGDLILATGGPSMVRAAYK